MQYNEKLFSIRNIMKKHNKGYTTVRVRLSRYEPIATIKRVMYFSEEQVK